MKKYINVPLHDMEWAWIISQPNSGKIKLFVKTIVVMLHDTACVFSKLVRLLSQLTFNKWHAFCMRAIQQNNKKMKLTFVKYLFSLNITD